MSQGSDIRGAREVWVHEPCTIRRVRTRIHHRLESAKESFRLENKKEKSSLCHPAVWADLSNAFSNAPLAPLRAQTKWSIV